MKKHKFEKGDLVRVNPSYSDATVSGRAHRTKLYGDVGIVLDTEIYPRWPHIVSVYWSILQIEVRIQKVYLEPINEKA